MISNLLKICEETIHYALRKDIDYDMKAEYLSL